jgi:hypothetical protein
VRSTAQLREYLRAVDLCYLAGHLGELGTQIRWMRRDAPTHYGRYLDGTIEINRRLALDSVPLCFVLSIVHHEALHAVLGPEHDARFHAAEKLFALGYEAATWEREHAHELLLIAPPRGLR